jgi:hypothetical protein
MTPDLDVEDLNRIAAEMLEDCDAAVADQAYDAAQAFEGERTDLWDPPEVCVSSANLRHVLTAYQEAVGRVGELEAAQTLAAGWAKLPLGGDSPVTRLATIHSILFCSLLPPVGGGDEDNSSSGGREAEDGTLPVSPAAHSSAGEG